MMPLNNASPAFEQRYASHLKHLKLQGLQTKTVDAYARAIRTMGEHFDWQIDTLSEDQLTDYFHQRIASHSWSAVKLDLYGYKFYVDHVLRQPWAMPRLIRPPERTRVQIRDSKGNRDRFVPLPAATLLTLRRFWQEHRNPELLFPNRHGGLKAAAQASTPLDRGGVQRALRQVALACGIKKKSAHTAYATVMQLT
jgi:integrase/recombinase XerD